MKFAAALGFCLVVLLPVRGDTAQAPPKSQPIRVGVYQNEPKVLIDAAGNPEGFWVDLLDEIAAAEHWTLEYVSCQWEQCLREVEAGTLDLMVDVAYSPDRDRRFDFNQEVVLSSWSVVYARLGVTLNSVLDLDQKRVAVLRGSVQQVALTESIQTLRIEPQLVTVSSFTELFQRIETGDVDAGIVNNFFGAQFAPQHSRVVKTHILLDPARLHFIVPEGDPRALLPPLDRALEAMQADANSAYYQARAQWLEPAPTLSWGQVRQVLGEVTLATLLVGVMALIAWNRLLRREVCRRKQAEARLQSIADNVPGVVFGYRLCADGTDQFTYLSSGFQDLYGIEPEVALRDSRRVWSLVHPDDMDSLQQSVTDSCTTLETWQHQHRIITPDGQVKWLQGMSRPTRHPNGDVTWDGLLIDISDRKRTEIALRESEHRFRHMAVNVPGAILQYVLHPDGSDGVIYMSPGCYDLWEVEPEAVVKDASLLWDMIHPDDRPRIYESVMASAQTLQPWSEQWRITTPSGQRKWLEAMGRPRRQDNGDVLWDTLIWDVSDRKRAELALQTSEQRLATLVSNLPGFIYRMANTPNYPAEYVSPGIFAVTGYPPQAYLGHDPIYFGQQIHPEDRQKVWEQVQQAVDQRQPYEYEYRILTRSGAEKWVWERGQGIFSDTGELLHLEGFITDISDRKQAEMALQASEIRYRKVVEAQTDFIVRSRPDTTITFANQAFCQVVGMAVRDLVGKSWRDLVTAEPLSNQVFDSLTLDLETPRTVIESQVRRASGEEAWVQWLNEGIFDETGRLVEIQSVGRDITPLKQVEQALRDSEERLRLVTENMSDLVCLHHPDGRYLYVTPSSYSLLGYRPEELIGQDPYELVHPDDRDRVWQTSHIPALNRETVPITYRIRQKSGTYIWLETLTQTIVDRAGQVMHLQTTSRNVSDRVRAEQQLKHDALHDNLTGLPNRSLLTERLELALKRAKRHPDFQFAVLFMDLDDFKMINDSMGHLAGDELLLTVATLLQEFIRETDLAARLGGDEFVILLEDLDTVEEAVHVAERILATLRSPIQLAEREVFTSASIGIVIGNPGHTGATDLLRDADLAMYRAKQQGRQQYVIFDPTMHQQVIQRLHLEHDLRRALEKQQFVLHYQPIIALDGEEIRGFEALIRWHHPQRGLISPGEFIELAEATGLVVPIGQWVLHTACQQLADWQAQFPRHPLKISVNLSVKQLHPALLTDLDTVLQSNGLEGRHLALEITESMLVTNVEATRELLEEIRARGVRISIDDFGTGYSSLMYLHQLPVDALKIDRTFVNSIGVDGRNQVIAESIIALCNLLELNAIAEGIETHQQLAWLQTLGCELGQGHLFAPAMSAERATQLLQQAVSSSL